MAPNNYSLYRYFIEQRNGVGLCIFQLPSCDIIELYDCTGLFIKENNSTQKLITKNFNDECIFVPNSYSNILFDSNSRAFLGMKNLSNEFETIYNVDEIWEGPFEIVNSKGEVVNITKDCLKRQIYITEFLPKNYMYNDISFPRMIEFPFFQSFLENVIVCSITYSEEFATYTSVYFNTNLKLFSISQLHDKYLKTACQYPSSFSLPSICLKGEFWFEFLEFRLYEYFEGPSSRCNYNISRVSSFVWIIWVNYDKYNLKDDFGAAESYAKALDVLINFMIEKKENFSKLIVPL
jgi:hypothetical protein